MTRTHVTVTSEPNHRCREKAKIEVSGEAPFWKRCVREVGHPVDLSERHMWVSAEDENKIRMIVEWTADEGQGREYVRIGYRLPESDMLVRLRETITKAIMEERNRRWQEHLRIHPHSNAGSCPYDYGEHDALFKAAELARTIVFDG